MPTPRGYQLELPDEAATDRLGHAIARCLHAGDVVALNGPLGAGKTRLTRALAIAAGVDPSLIHSPTYVLANAYPANSATLASIIHIDAYRLSEDDDLSSVLDLEHASSADAAIVIEWAERLMERDDAAPITSRVTLSVELAHLSPTARRATLTGELAATVIERFSRTPAAAVDAGQRTEESSLAPRCRTCSKRIVDQAFFPFCSDRCRVVDLGHWAEESYRISRAIKDSDLDEDE